MIMQAIYLYTHTHGDFVVGDFLNMKVNINKYGWAVHPSSILGDSKKKMGILNKKNSMANVKLQVR